MVWRAMAWLLAVGLVLCAPSAQAQELPVPWGEEHITVYGDPFARWDGTRWFIRTDVALPYLMFLRADRNHEFRTHRYQVRAVIECDKEWKLGRRRYEVGCRIEDIGLQVVASERRPTHVAEVLAEVHEKLNGAALRLQVSQDGRVTNLFLDGVEPSNRREREIQESLRQLMSRVVVGFDLRLPTVRRVEDGRWVEHNPALMTVPLPPGSSEGPTSMGSSLLLHHVSPFRGYVLVQSVGVGTIATNNNYFNTTFNGVAVYDPQVGFVTERVWALVGEPTTSSWIAEAGTQAFYLHAGRILRLGEDDHPDVGVTRQVTLPGMNQDGVPLIEPIEPLEDLVEDEEAPG